MSISHREMYSFGTFTLDAAGGVLYEGGRAVPLAPKQIDTLVVLVRARGQVVDRDTLIKAVWPDTLVEEAGLTRNISILRKAIERDGPSCIETIPKRGYRFVAPVEPVCSTADADRLGPSVASDRPAGSANQGQVSETASGPVPAGRSWRRFAPAAVLLLGMLAGVGSIWTSGPSTGRLPKDVASMAVLPFRHLNPDPGDRHLGVGLADALITRFASLSSIVILPTSTVLPYVGQDALGAGRALKVDAVLDGTIRRSARRVRVTVQLLDVATGRPLWAGSFDEANDELIGVEDAVANAVAGLLVPNLGRNERTRLARRATVSATAWQDYVRGRALWATRGPRELEDAIAAFQSAIAADPAYALAHVGLAQALMAQSSYQYRWARQVMPLAKDAVIRALELDPELADAHAVLGAIAFTYDWDWTTAERELRRGIALNPNEPTLYQLLSNLLMARGRLSESVTAAETAVRLDPQGFAPNSNLTLMLNWARRFEESVAQGERAMTVPGIPAFPALQASASYYLLGKQAQAQALYEFALKAIGEIPVVVSTEARYEAVAGRPARARRLLGELERRSEREVVEPIFIAAPYVNIGDHDRALLWLQRAAAERSAYAPYMAVDPSFDALHDDPRFMELLGVIGIKDVLRSSKGAHPSEGSH